MPLSEAERSALREDAAALGVSLDGEALDDLGRYLDELDRWRPKVNLVSVRTRDELIERHLLDSLAALPLIEPKEGPLSVADLGSGAGLPGIPLAIARPELRVSLVEPRRKRASFLRAVVRLLDRAQLTVIEARAEDVGPADGYGSFDVVTSRAAFGAAAFPSIAAPLLRSGGFAIAYTTSRVEARRPHAGSGFEAPRGYAYRIRGRRSGLELTVWRRR